MIGFAGLTHLGLVSSIVTAAKGFKVIAYDPDAELCDALRVKQLPILEPDLSELLVANGSRIHFSANPEPLNQCELVFLSLDVPVDKDSRSDLSALDGLIAKVEATLAPSTVFVILSQVPPGFTRRLRDKLSRPHNNCAFKLFYQVETLIVGRAVERALHPERFIVGCTYPDAALPAAYSELLTAFDCPILTMRYESAELAKVSINVMLASSVSTSNLLSEVCEVSGAEWSEIVPALRLDRRIGPHAYLNPGLGISGGNLERDLMTVKAVASRLGTDVGIIDEWLSYSRYRRDWVLKILHAEVFSGCENPVIAIWGLTYKPDTASTKNSPALTLIEALRPFAVRVYDPRAGLVRDSFARHERVESPIEACRVASALAIMTQWPEFSEVDLVAVRDAMCGRVIIDPFGALERNRCEDLGFSYFRLGSPASIQNNRAC